MSVGSMVMASRDSESGNRWVVRGDYSGSILPAMHRSHGVLLMNEWILSLYRQWI